MKVGEAFDDGGRLNVQVYLGGMAYYYGVNIGPPRKYGPTHPKRSKLLQFTSDFGTRVKSDRMPLLHI